jgi:hypothetical protein
MVWVGSIAALSFCLLVSMLSSSSGQDMFKAIMGSSGPRRMTRGARSLSIVDRIVTDDGMPSKTTKGGSTTDDADESSKPQSYGFSAAARKIMVDTSTKSSSNSTTNTTKLSGNATKIGPTVKETVAPTKPKPTDPGEHHSDFKKPLPPSYNYKDDDVNFPGISLDSQLNPVVDDISQFLDDEVYPNVTHSVLPRERKPPTNWPLDVFVIFLGSAIVLFAATAYKNYQKRKAYMAVSSS